MNNHQTYLNIVWLSFFFGGGSKAFFKGWVSAHKNPIIIQIIDNLTISSLPKKLQNRMIEREEGLPRWLQSANTIHEQPLDN